MQPFEYARPTTKENAVKLLGSNWDDAEVLAGGTDLLDRTKDFVSSPKRVVSLHAVKEFQTVKVSAGEGLSIGCMVTLNDLAHNAQVRRAYPVLVDVANDVGSPQIRNVGTVGGNLCQRPRCWYYRAGYGLLAQDNGKPLVPDGDNRYHAILGNDGPAYFVSPSSMAVVLIALDAKVKLLGPDGPREMPLDQFYVIPKSTDDREHALKPNEIVTEVTVPPLHGAKTGWYSVEQKEGLDWPLVQAAAVLHMSGKTVKSARIVLGHVAPTPWPSPEAGEAMAGKSITEESADAAGKAAVSKASPLSKNKYKVQLARVAVKRAIMKAAQGGREEHEEA
ncbi:MAG TPA: xanthine dehydrogenase family protein subunit M [Terriglobia bacterium]|nr:xanthine dehydrogenase family protein subunit M [Terriglobia bacterium]